MNQKSQKRGTLILIVGASGTGKDTLLDAIRQQHGDGGRIQIARRVITRPSDAGGEQHIATTVSEFEKREQHGEFLQTWRAHDLAYGLPLELRGLLSAGTTVLANVSRTVIGELHTKWPQTIVVEITASESLRRKRLENRARENGQQIESRVSRAVAGPPSHVPHYRFTNDASIERARAGFLELIEQLATGPYQVDQQIGYLLRRAHQFASGIFQEHMDAYGITPQQFATLSRLFEHHELSQNHLGRMIDTDPATMQGIVKRLVERGWIDRRGDTTHKRRMLLRLTEPGRAMLSDAVPNAFAVSRRTMAELSDTEQAQLLLLLRKLVGNEER